MEGHGFVSDIRTGNSLLDGDLRQLQELLNQSDLDKLLTSDAHQIMRNIRPSVFRLIVMLSTEGQREDLLESVQEDIRNDLQILSEQTTAKFGVFLETETGKTLVRSVSTISPVDEMYDSVRAIRHTAFLWMFRMVN